MNIEIIVKNYFRGDLIIVKKKTQNESVFKSNINFKVRNLMRYTIGERDSFWKLVDLEGESIFKCLKQIVGIY